MQSILSRRSEPSIASGMVSAVIGAPPRAWRIPSPECFVATTQASRRPPRANQSPTISSLSPTVSAATGFTGYISAVSRKSTPASSARSICAWASAREVCVPKVMVPRQSSLTSIPVRPSGLRRIDVSFPGCGPHPSPPRRRRKPPADARRAHHLGRNTPGVNWPQAKRGQRPLPPPAARP
jgi:hypothetical protein